MQWRTTNQQQRLLCRQQVRWGIDSFKGKLLRRNVPMCIFQGWGLNLSMYARSDTCGGFRCTCIPAKFYPDTGEVWGMFMSHVKSAYSHGSQSHQIWSGFMLLFCSYFYKKGSTGKLWDSERAVTQSVYAWLSMHAQVYFFCLSVASKQTSTLNRDALMRWNLNCIVSGW